jgi:DNA polymerase I-like protein with 3'-5' exonuclease and polymerase domains
MKPIICPTQELAFSPPPSDWRPPRVADLPSWGGAKRVAVDCETSDPTLKTLGPGVRRGGFIAGYSFAIEDGPSYYVPLRHMGGDNVEDPEQAMNYLRDQARDFDGTVVGMNLGYDLDFMLEAGVEFSNLSCFRDVMLSEALIYELHDAYNLDAILPRYGLPGKDETLLRRAAQHYGLDPKAQLWMLPARYVGAYGEGDVSQLHGLLRRQERVIEEQELERIVTLENQVLPVLVRMRRRGVRVNMEKLERIETWALQQEAAALQEVHSLTGIRIEVGDTMKASAVAPALEKSGVMLERTSTDQPQVDKEVLLGAGPVGASILHARKVAKLKNTFAASVRQFEIKGRIHCQVNQMVRPRDDEAGAEGARYGRVSVSKPNLQQQPSRDEFAPMWRDIYEPEEGALWGSADYASQEPRMQAHYAIMAKVGGADDIERAYKENPDLDPHAMSAALTGLERKPAKTIYLGKCYGMGSGKMARSLGLPTVFVFSKRLNRNIEVAGPEAQEIFEQFDQRMPHVSALAKLAEKAAADRGYLTTIGGRRCRFPKTGSRFDWTYKAMNRLIQGSSADQMKMAMVAIDAESYYMQLQVHDETDSSVGSEKDLSRIAEIMRDVLPLKVPVRVDYKIGPSWGSIK